MSGAQSGSSVQLPMMNNTRWNSQYQLVKKLLQEIVICPSHQEKLNTCKKDGSFYHSQINMLKELFLFLDQSNKQLMLSINLMRPSDSSFRPILMFQTELLLIRSSNSDSSPIRTKECKKIAEALKSSIVKRMNECLKGHFCVIRKKPHFLILHAR